MTGHAIAAFATLPASLEGTPEIEAQIRDHVARQIEVRTPQGAGVDG